MATPPIRTIASWSAIIIALLQIPATATAQPGGARQIEILYPERGGTILALPHVAVILQIKGQLPDDKLTIWIDGRKLPEEAVGYCAICAGQNPAILVEEAPWIVTEGRHEIVVQLESPTDTTRLEQTYFVDTATPGMTGLTGGPSLPSGFAPSRPAARVGGLLGESGMDGGGWLAASTGGPLSLEAAARSPAGHAWKLSLSPPQGRWGLGAGQIANDAFAALSYRLQPSTVSLTAGTGEGLLPGAWLAADLSLSLATSRIKYPQSSRDFFALVDLLHLKFEWAEGGQGSFGASMQHPYGWEASLFKLSQGGWRLQASLTLSLR